MAVVGRGGTHGQQSSKAVKARACRRNHRPAPPCPTRS
ncbi:hypothetical protein SZ55_3608 [Pseudomonas sp. FeS53a]|nr:hypothetical protein SZ55_3608 [Pseudomonas sp. FeS53a]